MDEPFGSNLLQVILWVISAGYFFLPGFAANMAPPAAKKLGLPFGRPICEPICGAHKTWRGFYVGILASIFVLYVQTLIGSWWLFEHITYIDYDEVNALTLGFLFGFGSLLGDLIESVYKRHWLKIPPGTPFQPWDQVDFIVGGMLFVYAAPSVFSQVGLGEHFWATFWVSFLTPKITGLINRIAYRNGWKDEPH